MFLGRKDELQYLENHYQKAGSQMVVLYGRKHMGKTSLLKKFVESKNSVYFHARACSEKEQIHLWSQEIQFENAFPTKINRYYDIFSQFIEHDPVKKVFIIDEFHFLVKAGTSFFDDLIQVLHEQWNKKNVMIILCSSAIGFIEHNFVKKIGKAAYEISGFLKLKELEFQYLQEYFSNYSKEDCMKVFAILGGVVGLWSYFDVNLSLKENILSNILNPGCLLYSEAERMVGEELREQGVYQTLLSILATGKSKLNDIYLESGFSRAKISVYLKNLMELDLIEKVHSFDLEGNENAQKGIYRISDHFLHFSFWFLFPHQSALNLVSKEEFYHRYLEPDLKKYTGVYFHKICTQYIKSGKKLPRSFLPKKVGAWIGKTGIIDIVAEDETGKILLGICNFEKPIMEYEDYEWLLYSMKQAKVHADFIYLFSHGRFDEKLNLESKIKKQIRLVELKDL